MRQKKLNADYGFRLMKKKKGGHLDRPQVHFGSLFNYISLSDTQVIDLRNWLSRYIAEYVKETPTGEIIKASRVHANRIRRNMDKLYSSREREKESGK